MISPALALSGAADVARQIDQSLTTGVSLVILTPDRYELFESHLKEQYEAAGWVIKAEDGERGRWVRFEEAPFKPGFQPTLTQVGEYLPRHQWPRTDNDKAVVPALGQGWERWELERDECGWKRVK